MIKILVPAAMLAALATSACVSREAVKEAGEMQSAVYNLKRMHEDIKKVYYDPQLRGLDMEARYDTALIAVSQSKTEQQRFKALSNYLLALDDSHTYYIGGSPVSLGDFGLSFRFYGDKAHVSAVNSWAPASVKALHRGDEIVKFAGQTLTRDNYYRVVVDFLGRHPIPDLDLEIRGPDQTVRNVTIPADTAAWRKIQGKQYRALEKASLDSMRKALGHITASIQNRVFVWKLPEFEEADLALGKVARAAGKHETVILDMRGNPGGPIKRLEEVLGFFIERPIDIGTLHMRWDEEKFRSKPKRDRLTNRLILLTDSETASAAEVFTRLLQLDNRAVVIGDRTQGAVMASMVFGYASITVSDFVLHNGERLEKVGVKPDVTVIPTTQELFDGHDPVLAHAINMAGIRITPAQAATVLKTK